MLLSHFLILNREKWNFQVVLLVVKTQRIFSIKDTVLHVWEKLNSIFGYRSFVLFFCGKQRKTEIGLCILWLAGLEHQLYLEHFSFSPQSCLFCVLKGKQKDIVKKYFSPSAEFSIFEVFWWCWYWQQQCYFLKSSVRRYNMYICHDSCMNRVQSTD